MEGKGRGGKETGRDLPDQCQTASYAPAIAVPCQLRSSVITMTPGRAWDSEWGRGEVCCLRLAPRVCRLQAAAFEQLVEVRHQTKLGLRYALSRRKHFVCELDVRPIQLMLPYQGSAANTKYAQFLLRTVSGPSLSCTQLYLHFRRNEMASSADQLER